MTTIRPDPEHDAVCSSAGRHLLVTAPPGTGKTFLSVRLASELTTRLPSYARVLLLTFSNQARTQLEREAVRQMPPHLRRRVEITNYHRFFWSHVLSYARALGLPQRLDIGSRKRRNSALDRVDHNATSALVRDEELLESLAEHEFPEFQDDRTPSQDHLSRLLRVVKEEQGAGRLVFDDLGALFWSLVTRFPSVEQALCNRYPAVIADEHQDASALQDAVVRRLGRRRLVVFADPLQLIHRWRGARDERIQQHKLDCDETYTLSTPHRWHADMASATWLLAVRARLEGQELPAEPPPTLSVSRTPAEYGLNRMKPVVRTAVARAFERGLVSVCVLVRTNAEAGMLRKYLCREGMYPRYVGSDDFEEARSDIEQLPLLSDPQSVALYSVERLQALVPAIPPQLIRQVRRRLTVDGPNLRGASASARGVLRALERLYHQGAERFFECLLDAINVCVDAGHHIPRVEAVRALRVTAESLGGQAQSLDAALERYARAVIDGAHAAPRPQRGLFVMTAHQAKGKEFDSVILVNVSRQRWPEDDDTRRLFYVAITRATSSWVVIAPDEDASPFVEALLH